MKSSLDEDFNGWFLSLPSGHRVMVNVVMSGFGAISNKKSNQNRLVAC